MDYIASLYPPLSKRRPFPIYYLPVCFSLTIIPLLLPKQRYTRLVAFLLLLLFCARSPCYTNGSPSSDYYNSGIYLTMPLWYLDFVLFRSANGSDAPIFNGVISRTSASEKRPPIGLANLKSLRQKIAWAVRLMIPPNRGIGWNWQVKNIPADPDSKLPRWDYVRVHLRHAVVSYLRSVVMLVILGFTSRLQNDLDPMKAAAFSFFVDALIGWSGAIWVWDRLCCFYSLAAASSVAIGLCETWEWPPLMGHIQDAWSVRQMWSVVYHQTLRRMLQQPAIQITRLLHLRKGSIGSRYTQLYVSFGISCILHEFQMFNVTRRDMGEFAFFMSQPIAITVEDFVEWIWHMWYHQELGHPQNSSERKIGYIWVFLWFSYSLPFYIKALRDADIIRDAFLDVKPFEFGSSLGTAI